MSRGRGARHGEQRGGQSGKGPWRRRPPPRGAGCCSQSETVVATRPGRPAPPQGSRTGPRSAAQVPFSRFAIQMLEQSLREEDLRARHQAALLRLREKALQEKTRAELVMSP